MTLDLNDFEAAFDRIRPAADPDRTWKRVERAVRRRLRGPTLELAAGVALFVLLVAFALERGGPAWGYAGFFLLVVLPARVRARRRWLADLAAVESPDDIRALCAAQARFRAAGFLARAILMGGLGLLFLAAGLVAHLLDESPWPGAIAGALVLVWAAVLLLVRTPLAARELAILGDDE